MAPYRVRARAPSHASGPLGARRWRPGTAPAAAEPHRRRGVAPKGLVMISNKICMWSLPRSRSAAVAPIGPRRVLIARCPLAASAADRNPGRDHICFMLGSMARPLGATPLRRRGSAAAGAVPGRHLRAPSGQRSTGGGRRVKAHAPGRGMAPFCRHRTIPGCPDAYRRWSTRSNPRLMRGAPPIRTAACARRPLRARLDRGTICVATL